MLRRIVAAGLAIFLPACAYADPAQTPNCPDGQLCLENLSARQLLAIAQAMIDRGELAPALQILQKIQLKQEEETERRFLLGQIAMAQGNSAEAVRLFRSILADRPELTRVRLELARALFLRKDDEAADYHFRLAMADAPPKGVQETIMIFRNAIRNRRSWQLSFELGLAPDSNINGATADRDFSIGGIPATQVTITPPTSGLGLLQAGNTSWTPLRRGGLALRLGAFNRMLLYRDMEYSDILLGGDIGVEKDISIGRLSLAATGQYRWYGARPYAAAPGVRLGYEGRVSPRWLVGAQVAYRQMDYLRNDDLDGPVIALLAQSNRTVSSVSFISLSLGVQRESTRSAGYANWEVRGGLGYGREMPWGLTGYAYGEIGAAPYDAVQAFFGKTRKDVRWRGQLSLLKRDWSAYGFAPRLRYNFYRVDSNIGFYSYTRHQSEITLTRIF